MGRIIPTKMSHLSLFGKHTHLGDFFLRIIYIASFSSDRRLKHQCFSLHTIKPNECHVLWQAGWVGYVALRYLKSSRTALNTDPKAVFPGIHSVTGAWLRCSR